MFLPCLNENQQNILLGVARRSIKAGLETRLPFEPLLSDYDNEFTAVLATFVTLKINGQLRGCIGSLVANQPLVIDVAQNAFTSAFADPRFKPLTIDEFDKVNIQLSILSSPEQIDCFDEMELVDSLNPDIDGLILEDGNFRATYLPTVWQSIPDPLVFIMQLKLKAGLPADYWSETIKFYRYATLCFGEKA